MKYKTGFIAGMVMCCNVAQAEMVWQPAPPDSKPQQSMSGHQGHGGRGGGMPFLLQDADGAEAEMWLPTRVRRPLHIAGDGRVLVRGTGVTSYHLLFARKSGSDREDVAMRYISLQGKPSGESPASLVNAGKAVLDVTPAPLTREHQRYLGKQTFYFTVNFEGRALRGHGVSLSTSNGTEVSGVTDANGRVGFRLPDDFVDVEPGRGSNRPAEFIVAVSHVAEGKAYHTTLSAPYHVSPSHWQSTSGGLLAMVAGMVTGLVVLRRSRKNGDITVQGRA